MREERPTRDTPDLERQRSYPLLHAALHATHIALDIICIRGGLKWLLPAMLLILPYVYVASFCLQLIETGALLFDYCDG